MSYQHKNLAEGAWGNLSFMDQMANIGSEIERVISWQAKNNADYAQKSLERALELIDLTLDSQRDYAHLKEVARMREAVVDYFSGTNQFLSSKDSWRGYFLPFAFASRRKV